jgi:hypothetical protein
MTLQIILPNTTMLLAMSNHFSPFGIGSGKTAALLLAQHCGSKLIRIQVEIFLTFLFLVE